MNIEQFTFPFFRYVKYQKSFLYSGVRIWNDLPINLRSIEKLNKFKAEVRKLFVGMIFFSVLLCKYFFLLLLYF